jgi:hypothetical protein
MVLEHVGGAAFVTALYVHYFVFLPSSYQRFLSDLVWSLRFPEMTKLACGDRVRGICGMHHNGAL